MGENKFKIGQKVMVVKPVREEDRFKVGTVDSMYTDDSGHWVVIITAEAREFYLEAMLEPLPETLQGKTIAEAERAVKSVAKVAEALAKAIKTCAENLKAEAEQQQAEALKQLAEPFKDKRIAELEKQVEDLKRELVQRPIVILPKEAVVSIRVGKAMEEYEAIKSRN